MKTLPLQAKTAIIHLLDEIAHADGVVRPEEEALIASVARSLEMPLGYDKTIESISCQQAQQAIAQLTDAQKNEVAKVMGRMIVADNDINYNEVLLYNDFCKACSIENSFSIDDYPEATTSGFPYDPEEPEF